MKPADIKILVVDDEKNIREAIVGLFRAFGFDCSMAHSGESAWDALISNNYHIVITDIRMADGGGMELLQKIRERNLESPKVFLITGFSDFTLEHIYDLGADGLFNKPFDSKLLMETVRHALLAPKDRWAVNKAPDSAMQLNAEYSTLEDCEVNKSFMLGRGGFFIELGEDVGLINVNQPVTFELSFQSPELQKLSGSGVVRWCRQNEATKKIGLGVEFHYLDPESIAAVTELLSKREAEFNLAVIPRGL